MLYGSLNADGKIIDGKIIQLTCESETDGNGTFSGEIPCTSGGRQGYAVRVRSDHPDLVHPFTPLLMKWE